MNDVVTLLISNVISLAVGLLLGKAFRWKRVHREHGPDTVVPTLDNSAPRSRLIGVAVALMALGITVQTAYANVQQSRTNNEQAARNQAQTECNSQIGQILEENAELTGMERRLLNDRRDLDASLFRDIAIALSTPSTPRPEDLAGILTEFDRQAQSIEAQIDSTNARRTAYVDPQC